jgi:hypothetical protein
MLVMFIVAMRMTVGDLGMFMLRFVHFSSP